MGGYLTKSLREDGESVTCQHQAPILHCECVDYLLSVLGLVNEYLASYYLPLRERPLTSIPLRECLGNVISFHK